MFPLEEENDLSKNIQRWTQSKCYYLRRPNDRFMSKIKSLIIYEVCAIQPTLSSKATHQQAFLSKIKLYFY
jgi:hypothetical protein